VVASIRRMRQIEFEAVAMRVVTGLGGWSTRTTGVGVSFGAYGGRGLREAGARIREYQAFGWWRRVGFE